VANDEKGPTIWKTGGGYFTTATKTPQHNLFHNFKVDKSPKQNTDEYDMII